MNPLEILQCYRWSVREREVLEAQLETLEHDYHGRSQGAWQHSAAVIRRRQACRDALLRHDARLAEVAEGFERILQGVVVPRTRLVLRQYYGPGMTDEEIAEADGFSPRLAGSIRNGWLREQGLAPRRREAAR